MPSVEVKGQQKLGRLADLLEEKGNAAALKRRMTKAVRPVGETIAGYQRVSLAEKLPKRGGAAATVTGEAKLSVRTSYARAEVTIVDSWPGHSMRAIDRGTLRHPLFGNRKHWFDTRVVPGILTKPFLAHRRDAARAVSVEMDALLEEIAKEA